MGSNQYSEGQGWWFRSIRVVLLDKSGYSSLMKPLSSNSSISTSSSSRSTSQQGADSQGEEPHSVDCFAADVVGDCRSLPAHGSMHRAPVFRKTKGHASAFVVYSGGPRKLRNIV